MYRRSPLSGHLLPAVLKREMVIYFILTFPLWADLSPSSAAESTTGQSIHNGTVHEHLHRPGGLEPELIYGWHPFIVFAFFSALCITPRLLLGSASGSAQGGGCTMVESDFRSGLGWALVHHYAQVLFPRWLNWAFYFVVLSTFQAPSPRSLAFLEWLLLSIVTCSLSLPTALAFAACRVAELYIHPFRR